MKKIVNSPKLEEKVMSDDKRLIRALEKGDEMELAALEIRELTEKEIQLIATQTMLRIISSNTRKRLLEILHKNAIRFEVKS